MPRAFGSRPESPGAPGTSRPPPTVKAEVLSGRPHRAAFPGMVESHRRSSGGPHAAHRGGEGPRLPVGPSPAFAWMLPPFSPGPPSDPSKTPVGDAEIHSSR